MFLESRLDRIQLTSVSLTTVLACIAMTIQSFRSACHQLPDDIGSKHYHTRCARFASPRTSRMQTPSTGILSSFILLHCEDHVFHHQVSRGLDGMRSHIRRRSTLDMCLLSWQTTLSLVHDELLVVQLDSYTKDESPVSAMRAGSRALCDLGMLQPRPNLRDPPMACAIVQKRSRALGMRKCVHMLSDGKYYC